MSVKPTTVSQDVQPHQDSQPFTSRQRTSSQRHLSDDFCYRCGEDGHFATKCSVAENYQKVIQKLIRVQ